MLLTRLLFFVNGIFGRFSVLKGKKGAKLASLILEKGSIEKQAKT